MNLVIFLSKCSKKIFVIKHFCLIRKMKDFNVFKQNSIFDFYCNFIIQTKEI